MIDDLDEALRQLLIREMPIKNGDIDISFDQPKREWSARVNRPTLNFFLFDMRENTKLRSSQPVWEPVREAEGVTQKRRPVRMDIRYLITAWTTEPEDEHRLLGRALAALFRYPHLPDNVLPEGLRSQPMPIPLQVAQGENLPNTSDIWSALENTLRAGIVLQATLAVDPYVVMPPVPEVRTRELRIGQVAETALSLQLSPAAAPEVVWSVGGSLRRKDGQPAVAELRLVERNQLITLRENGRFAISNLQAGQYTLEVAAGTERPQRFTITVPAPDYALEIG